VTSSRENKRKGGSQAVSEYLQSIESTRESPGIQGCRKDRKGGETRIVRDINVKKEGAIHQWWTAVKGSNRRG